MRIGTRHAAWIAAAAACTCLPALTWLAAGDDLFGLRDTTTFGPAMTEEVELPGAVVIQRYEHGGTLVGSRPAAVHRSLTRHRSLLGCHRLGDLVGPGRGSWCV